MCDVLGSIPNMTERWGGHGRENVKASAASTVFPSRLHFDSAHSYTSSHVNRTKELSTSSPSLFNF